MNKPVLTKTCNTCGLQKPLSAFLQLGGSRGAIYGNICSSCRKTAMEKANRKPKDEDSTSSTTGHRVDSKAKVQGDTNKKEAREQIKELYREEHEKEEKIESELAVTLEKTKEQEKQKLGKLEKSSFLTAPRKPMEVKHQIEKATQQTFEAEQTEQQVEFIKQERQQKGIDLTAPFEGTRMAGQERFKSVVFRQFATLLGTNTVIGKAMGNAAVQHTKAAKTAVEKNAKEATPSEEPLNEFIKQEWKPKSGR